MKSLSQIYEMVSSPFFRVAKVEQSNWSGAVLSEAVFLKIKVERSF